MSLNSVNTNVGAMMALESLSAINAQLGETLNHISTGLKISSPKDNPAVWAMAQNERAEVSSLDAVTSSLQRGQSIVDVAMSAGQSISDLLTQMKQKALAASALDPSDPSRQSLNDDYVALRKQIDTMASSADFDGVNLISAGGTGQVRALANTKGTDTIDVAHVDLSTSGALLSGLRSDLLGTMGATDISDLGTAISRVDGAVAKLGTGSNALDTHMTFVGKLQDTLQASIGNMVDADMAEESAKLQALQVRQQLAMMALQIANQAPSMLLQLFR